MIRILLKCHKSNLWWPKGAIAPLRRIVALSPPTSICAVRGMWCPFGSFWLDIYITDYNYYFNLTYISVQLHSLDSRKRAWLSTMHYTYILMGMISCIVSCAFDQINIHTCIQLRKWGPFPTGKYAPRIYFWPGQFSLRHRSNVIRPHVILCLKGVSRHDTYRERMIYRHLLSEWTWLCGF